jgi:5-methylcytosine-specific restriction endonuclease McrA
MTELICPYLDKESREQWYLEQQLDYERPKRIYKSKAKYVKIKDRLSPEEYAQREVEQKAKRKVQKEEWDKLWLEKNPNYLHAYNHQGRMRNRNKETYEAGDIKDVMQLAEWLSAQKGRPCPYCNLYEAHHIDHIIPIGKGGTHTWDNICVACDMCNKMKLDHYLEDWVAHMRVIVANYPEP